MLTGSELREEVLEPGAPGPYPVSLVYSDDWHKPLLEDKIPVPFMIPTVLCQDSLLLVSFSRTGQHVKYLCNFKHSLMPSFFLCIFLKDLSVISIDSPLHSLSFQPPDSQLCVSCWLHLYSWVIITSTKAATAGLRYTTFQLQTLLWPVLTGLDSFTGLQQLGTSAQFFHQVLFRLCLCLKYDAAREDTEQSYKSDQIAVIRCQEGGWEGQVSHYKSGVV